MMADFPMANVNAGMNSQVRVLLEAMSACNVTVPDGTWIQTLPYCNCREMGFVLSIRSRGMEHPTNIAFFEHRNSDNICAIKWVGLLPISGAVTPGDIPEGAYPDKWSVTSSWPYLSIREAIEWTREVITEIEPPPNARPIEEMNR